LIKKTKNPRFVWDSYRRFIQMFGNTAMDIEHHGFETIITNLKKSRNIKNDTEMNVEDL
jgi:pyruvate,orthophosphate dikinase